MWNSSKENGKHPIASFSGIYSCSHGTGRLNLAHVKRTPKVTGFIGSRTEPAVIPDEEVDQIKTQMAEGQEKPGPGIHLKKGIRFGSSMGLSSISMVPWKKSDRKGQAQGVSKHFWSAHAGGAGFHSGDEELNVSMSHDKAGMWQTFLSTGSFLWENCMAKKITAM